MDFNPKTNMTARATYEVLGFGSLAFGLIGGFVALALNNPQAAGNVVIGLLLLFMVGVIVFVIIQIIVARADELQYALQNHNDFHRTYHPHHCKHCRREEKTGVQAG